jgi:hypothetical protein
MNTLINKLINLRSNIDPIKSLAKKTKTELTDLLNALINEGIDTDPIKELLVKLGSEKILKKDKEIILEHLNKLISDNTTEIIKVDDKLVLLEKQLDDKIHCYSKYNEKNPMVGISWNEKLSTYKIENKELKLNTKSKDLGKACDKVKKEFSTKILILDQDICAKQFFKYKNNNVIIYDNLMKPLFDIRHTLSLLNLKENTEYKLYEKYKDKIISRCWKQNQHEGFYIKEFIDEKTMYQIVLDSKSEFSQQFKSDVSDILVKLRQSGKLTISNDKLQLENTIKTETQNKEFDELVQKHKHINYFNYNDTHSISKMSQMIYNTTKVCVSKYINTHTLYFFILTLNGHPDKIYCKIGYTYNILQRYKELKQEYGCSFYLIGIKSINAEHEEKMFHKSIKNLHQEMYPKYTINGKVKEEVYYLNDELINQFMDIPGIKVQDTNQINDELEDIIKNQYNNFIKELQKHKTQSFIELLSSFPTLSDESITDLVCKHDDNSYILLTKEMDIRHEEFKIHQENMVKLKDRDIELKDKDIELKDKDIELEKERTIQENERTLQEKEKTKQFELQIKILEISL